jgi:hypothetical protein
MSFLQTFSNLDEYIQQLQAGLKLRVKLRETQEQEIEKAKLAKEIGDSLLEQIKQGNST